MDNSYLKTIVFTSVVFLLTNDMTSKFIIGFITGIFVSTKYDFKPYVNLIEDKITGIQKELEIKKEEMNKPQMVDQNWGRFKEFWPWSKPKN